MGQSPSEPARPPVGLAKTSRFGRYGLGVATALALLKPPTKEILPVKKFRTVVSSPSSQLGSCLFLLALSVGCAGDNAKKVVSVGDGGEGGEAGAPVGSNTDSSPQAGTGGVSDPGSAGNGSAGEGAAQTEGGAGGAPGIAVAGASTNGEAGAAGAVSAAGAAGAAGEGGAPNFPVSSCGTGMWMAAEIGCQACPVAKQVFEMACADYESGQILMSGGIQNRLQFVFVNLPDGAQGHEASPVNVSVAYVTPDESHPRTVRLSTTAWSVDLTQAPEPPVAVIIPPFVTADVCGDVFRSPEPVRFNRIGEGSTASYEMVCP